MSQDRLTRQELGWLLAQEARGAAKALREGVSALTQPPPAGIPIEVVQAPEVETNLDALDEAISKLSELQMGAAQKPRRGRIDLAVLLCEVMPNARIAMEPGAGTEVFGEEAELKRMLHLLISQTNSSPVDSESARPDVVIKREDDWVRISVELGPDSSATAELERRWLSRMATRHGGKLELEGGTESILLPADRSQEETAELRRELEQAQQLGEVYARELAAAFATTEMPGERSPSQFPSAGSERIEIVISTSTAIARLLRGWLDGTRTDVGKVGEVIGSETDLVQRLTKRLSAAQELLVELDRIAACPVVEAKRSFDFAQELRDIVAAAEQRAVRHGVTLNTEAPAKLPIEARPAALALVVRSLIDHAIEATPRGGSVDVTLFGALGAGFQLSVEDGGPVVPTPSRSDLVHRRVDPTSLGRPEGLALLVAEAGASLLGATMSLGESENGRSEVTLSVV